MNIIHSVIINNSIRAKNFTPIRGRMESSIILLTILLLFAVSANAQSVQYEIIALGGSNGAAIDINDLGQIVGLSEMSSGETHAFLYQSGLMTDLGTLGGITVLPLGLITKVRLLESQKL